MASFKLERYCSCGGELVVESSGWEPVKISDEQFSKLHTGEGHVTSSKRVASRARRRQLIEDAEGYRRA